MNRTRETLSPLELAELKQSLLESLGGIQTYEARSTRLIIYLATGYEPLKTARIKVFSILCRDQCEQTARQEIDKFDVLCQKYFLRNLKASRKGQGLSNPIRVTVNIGRYLRFFINSCMKGGGDELKRYPPEQETIPTSQRGAAQEDAVLAGHHSRPRRKGSHPRLKA